MLTSSSRPEFVGISLHFVEFDGLVIDKKHRPVVLHKAFHFLRSSPHLDFF